jgi:hypothetical protein
MQCASKQEDIYSCDVLKTGNSYYVVSTDSLSLSKSDYPVEIYQLQCERKDLPKKFALWNIKMMNEFEVSPWHNAHLEKVIPNGDKEIYDEICKKSPDMIFEKMSKPRDFMCGKMCLIAEKYTPVFEQMLNSHGLFEQFQQIGLGRKGSPALLYNPTMFSDDWVPTSFEAHQMYQNAGDDSHSEEDESGDSEVTLNTFHIPGEGEDEDGDDDGPVLDLAKIKKICGGDTISFRTLNQSTGNKKTSP